MVIYWCFTNAVDLINEQLVRRERWEAFKEVYNQEGTWGIYGHPGLVTFCCSTSRAVGVIDLGESTHH